MGTADALITFSLTSSQLPPLLLLLAIVAGFSHWCAYQAGKMRRDGE